MDAYRQWRWALPRVIDGFRRVAGRNEEISMKRPGLIAAMALALLATGSATFPDQNAAVAQAPAAGDPSFNRFRDAFLERTFQLDPYFAVYQGRHEFDGQLPDWSPAGLKLTGDFLRQSI